MSKMLKIKVYQNDIIPGFACFNDNGSLKKESKCLVAININAFLLASKCHDLPVKELPYFMAESIMHEVIHCLEAWAGKKFSEKKVNNLIKKYQRQAEKMEGKI